MNRILIAIAALSLASAARAQEQDQQQKEPSVDVAALEGKVAALEEQYAETKSTVAGLSRLKWSGYMQARWAYLDCAGSSAPSKCSYNQLGTTFADRDNFFIRRGRIKAVYNADLAQFVLQLDATPSGVGVKEAYASVALPRSIPGNLSVDAGLQLLPFGYDVGVRSSSDLDLLERYRGANYWLKGEYDLGVAVRAAFGPVNFRGGVFNGNGVDGGGAGKDNDNFKDLIGRLGFDFGMVTGGVSGWYGKSRDFKAHPNKTYDRNRVGADLQIYLDLLPIGGTAIKGEFIAGKTGIGTQSDSTGVTAIYGADPGRAGHAWHATLVQNLGKPFQVAARYEQFVKNNNLEPSSSKPYRLKEIDELDVALHYYVGGNYKLSALWAHPMNGKKVGEGAETALDGTVKKTDQFVVQAQAKF